MENEFNKKTRPHNPWWDQADFEKSRQRGRIWGGIVLIAAGGLWMAHALGVALVPWVTTWPMILIVVGIFLLGKHGFKRPGGLIVLAVGGVFLAQEIYPNLHIQHIAWPVVIIVAGLLMILNPWKKARMQRWEQWKENAHLGEDSSSPDILQINAIFGGIEKNVVSKNFRGGEINCIMGGAEINLMNADIQGTVIMDVNTIFGGMEITVPANWRVKSELTAVLGGVSDKRPMNPEGGDENKVLVLRGAAIFGGVEIKSY